MREDQRAAKERRRIYLQPYKDAKNQLKDVKAAEEQDQKDRLKITETRDDWRLNKKLEAHEEKWTLLEKLTKGFRCPKCKKIIVNLRSWMINRRKTKALCRSCYHRVKHNPKRKEHLHMDIEIFEEESRYKLSPNHLIAARNETGLTQKEFALQAGWSRSYQSKLEGGMFLTVSTDTRAVILGVLKRFNITTRDPALK